MITAPAPSVDSIEVGSELPEYVIELTVQRLVMEAGVNKDFAPIHHDTKFAQERGAPDMYANTHFLQTMMEWTIRQWMGPAGRLRKLAFSMRAFNCAGDILTCRARVTAIRPADAQFEVDFDVWIESSRVGKSVDGNATVSIPIG